MGVTVSSKGITGYIALLDWKAQADSYRLPSAGKFNGPLLNCHRSCPATYLSSHTSRLGLVISSLGHGHISIGRCFPIRTGLLFVWLLWLPLLSRWPFSSLLFVLYIERNE